MKYAAEGYRVAVVGAASLLGKELLAVLKERQFPIARLVTPDALDEAEPDLPVLDLSGEGDIGITDANVGENELDFAFLAGPLPTASKKTGEADALTFLQSSRQLATAEHCKVIDLRECLVGESGGIVRIPSLERRDAARADHKTGIPSIVMRHASGAEREEERPSKYFISAHPATIVISTILLRLTSRFPAESVVVHMFGAASEIGSQAIEELQKQTLSLLSFQKIPQSVFGMQLAFNLLPRFGRGRKTPMADLESRIQAELTNYVGQRVPMPAVRAIQAPVFHSLAYSFYFQLVQPAPVEALTQALAGRPIDMRKATETAPTQVEAAGSGEIMVDAPVPDASHPAGVWIWAAADNLRLAALNAVEIAESLIEEKLAQVH